MLIMMPCIRDQKNFDAGNDGDNDDGTCNDDQKEFDDGNDADVGDGIFKDNQIE